MSSIPRAPGRAAPNGRVPFLHKREASGRWAACSGCIRDKARPLDGGGVKQDCPPLPGRLSPVGTLTSRSRSHTSHPGRLSLLSRSTFGFSAGAESFLLCAEVGSKQQDQNSCGEIADTSGNFVRYSRQRSSRLRACAAVPSTGFSGPLPPWLCWLQGFWDGTPGLPPPSLRLTPPR